jgi:hypothetical protein
MENGFNRPEKMHVDIEYQTIEIIEVVKTKDM